ncbi:hypothetical protein BN14_04097 [Rhizoctonia solani AG-1 IB]|uniref:Uncharacterized protein n=1 Tax=Thanatephorus cucumeris (strain AG1-IB / isolate 7/3/14) TaxID=1108050 RepID=M5BQJ2_THACB|nr:hypothetical protein BN14_04097 [Rhizoctonia solani AG-1 IB]
MPLIRHLSAEEYNDLLESMDEADYLLSRPLEVLEELVFTWRVQNESITTDWRSYPVGDLNSYEFGVELPANVVLEDLLAPLPYPTKPRRSMIHYISEHSEDQFPGTQAVSFDSAKTMMDPQCESTKELELKEKPKFKSKSNVFAISSFVRSRGSFDSRSEYSYGSDSSGMPWASTCEVVEKESEGMGDQESVARSGYIFNCANHRDTEMKPPSHKLLARRLKRVFRCA